MRRPLLSFESRPTDDQRRYLQAADKKAAEQAGTSESTISGHASNLASQAHASLDANVDAAAKQTGRSHADAQMAGDELGKKVEDAKAQAQGVTKVAQDELNKATGNK